MDREGVGGERECGGFVAIIVHYGRSLKLFHAVFALLSCDVKLGSAVRGVGVLRSASLLKLACADRVTLCSHTKGSGLRVSVDVFCWFRRSFKLMKTPHVDHSRHCGEEVASVRGKGHGELYLSTSGSSGRVVINKTS